MQQKQYALPADIPAPHYAGSVPPDNSLGEMVDEPTMEAEDDTLSDAMGDASADDARGALINGDQGAPTKRPSVRMRGPGRPRKRVTYNFAQKHSSSDTPIADSGPQGACPENAGREVRRSARNKTCVQKYDASTGKSVEQSS